MATDLEQVRAITGLTANDLSDLDVEALIDANGGSVKLASADALETYATTLTSVTADDISIDGSKRAAVLMARAARLRALAAQQEADSDDGFYFDVVGGVTGRPELTERERW